MSTDYQNRRGVFRNIPLLVEYGIDNNLVVYDNNAGKGEFTYNLIKYMSELCENTWNEKLKYLIFPKYPKCHFPPLFNPLIRIGAEAEAIEAAQALRAFGGSLAPDDETLIVGITEMGTVILGSY